MIHEFIWGEEGVCMVMVLYIGGPGPLNKIIRGLVSSYPPLNSAAYVISPIAVI